MRLRSNYYPIPMLVKGGDNYENSNFDTEINVMRDMHNIKIELNAELENKQLEKLLKAGDVVVGCHIECKQTCYRHLFTTSKYEEVFYIDESKLNGEVEIATFLTAARDIIGYTNNDFSEDYEGLSFDIHKGMRLGTGQWLKFKIEKNHDDFSDNPSIFAIVMDLSGKRTEFSIECDEEKIKIVLPEKSFNHYKAKSTDPQYLEVMHGLLLVPALMKVFYDLKQDGTIDYQDKRWYLSLQAAYKKAGRDIEQAINDGDPFEEAQKLLAGPLAAGLEKLTQGDDSDED